jgi:fatty acid desaturase
MEHHMFPMVPYYHLPALHKEIKHDCPAACPNFPAAVWETMVALWKTKADSSYVVPRYREFSEKHTGNQFE